MKWLGGGALWGSPLSQLKASFSSRPQPCLLEEDGPGSFLGEQRGSLLFLPPVLSALPQPPRGGGPPASRCHLQEDTFERWVWVWGHPRGSVRKRNPLGFWRAEGGNRSLWGPVLPGSSEHSGSTSLASGSRLHTPLLTSTALRATRPLTGPPLGEESSGSEAEFAQR